MEEFDKMKDGLFKDDEFFKIPDEEWKLEDG